MTDRLVVEKIRAEVFGGLRSVELDLGAGGLVVVAGPNESGKSSLSELISWLLVGPSGSASEAQRFGDPGDRIGGRLIGSLRDRRFQSTGEFGVLKAGAPNEGGMSVTFGGNELDAAEWRTRLGGVDAAMLDAVYVMWGAELHDGDDLMAKINEAALGGLPGSGNVGSLREELDESVRLLLTSKAATADSFSKLQAEVRDHNESIKSIHLDAREYSDLRAEHDGLGGQIDDLDSEIFQIRREITAREALLKISGQLGELDDVRGEVGALASVPESWAALVDAPESLTEAVDALEVAEDLVAEASARLRSATAAVGLTEPESSALTVGQPEVLTVSRLGAELGNARRDVANSDELLRARRSSQEARQVEFNRALEATRGQTLQSLRAVTLGAAGHAEMTKQIGIWQEAESRLALARSELRTAEGQEVNAAADVQRAHDAWDRFGTEAPAQEWLRSGGTGPVESGSGSKGSDLWVFAIAAAVAVGSSFVLPRIAWSVVTILAFVFAFVAQRAMRSRVGPSDRGGDSSVGGPPSEATRAAAEKVVEVEGILESAERAIGVARRGVDYAESERDSKARSAAESAAAVGVTLPGGPLESQAHLDAVNVAGQALRALDAASSDLAEVERQNGDLREATDRMARRLREALVAYGVPARVEPDDAPDNMTSFQAVTVARSAVEQAEADCEAALDLYLALVAPIAAEIVGWPRVRVVERLEDLKAVAERRAELDAKATGLQELIEHGMRDDATAQELRQQNLSSAEIESQKERFDEHLAERDRTRSGLQERRGQITERLEKIAQESELARLSAKVGALEDAASDRVIDAAARSIARKILTDVAEEQRQANQPALVQRATELLASAQSEWKQILVTSGGDDAEVSVLGYDGSEVSAHQLSTGARALLYLSLRLAMADRDAGERGFRFPIICDDPLVHIDDQRARAVLPLLAKAVDNGHQVILFTSHSRTVAAARAVGADVVSLGGGLD